MTTRRFLVSFVVLLAMVALGASAVFAADLFVGKWKENISKSTYSPGPPPKNPEEFTFQAIPNGLKYVSDYVNDKGQKGQVEIAATFDGKDCPIKALVDGKADPNAPDMISVKRVDDHTIEYEYKLKGRVVRRGKGVISNDGKIQTHTQTTLGPEGQAVRTNTIIYERQ